MQTFQYDEGRLSDNREQSTMGADDFRQYLRWLRFGLRSDLINMLVFILRMTDSSTEEVADELAKLKQALNPTYTRMAINDRCKKLCQHLPKDNPMTDAILSVLRPTPSELKKRKRRGKQLEMFDG